ncbi:MAG: hypothetical protein JKY99_05000, partial [Rhizobiales bacterium]|nr:hypothetical protein [Hyphomicrobiales bacterium]
MHFLKISNVLTTLAIASLLQFQPSFGGHATSKDVIGALIENSDAALSKIPLPTPRPIIAVATKTVAASVTDANPLLAFLPQLGSKMPKVSAKKGSLRTALKAISKNKILDAIAIRAGMKDPIDKAILTWRLARTGDDLVPYDMITGFQAEYPDFPTQSTLTRRAEQALARRKIGFQQVLSIYGNRDPLSIQGIVQKAEALQAAGQKKEA